MQTSFFQISSRTVVNFGAGSRVLLPNMLEGLGGKRVVLFADRVVARSGIINQIKELFEENQSEVQIVGIFEDIDEEARCETVNRCTLFFKKYNGDSLIALGGTGVLDTVKAVKWMVHKDLQDISEVERSTERWPEAQLISIPHIAVPTLTGTGAEVTAVAMITNEEIGIKSSIYNPFINPDIAILDPELTMFLSPEVTAFTGFTTLVNAIEAYFSPKANSMTDAYAQQAIRMIADNLSKAVLDGSNLEAKANMQLASLMAKSAFMPIVNAIPIHNMALAFCGEFGVPQMLANAVLLPNVMESLDTFYLSRIQGFAQALGIKDPSPYAKECLGQTVTFIRDLRKEIGLPETLVGFEVKVVNMKKIVLSVQKEPSSIHFEIPPDAVVKITSQIFDLSVNINQ
ncbi:iron-containing alcohol dehydrogenase [Neobacillus drentensis]|uniref:iron-containing alcohol dehydrogenase n=1 Tax=Neobacillus drentensis TaxID=220684 RepID=UPI002FFE169A